MRLTTDHSQSSYGIPVFVDDDNNVMDYSVGIKALRKEKNLTIKDIAEAIGVSPRTVEGWEQGRPINGPALKLLKMMIP